MLCSTLAPNGKWFNCDKCASIATVCTIRPIWSGVNIFFESSHAHFLFFHYLFYFSFFFPLSQLHMIPIHIKARIQYHHLGNNRTVKPKTSCWFCWTPKFKLFAYLIFIKLCMHGTWHMLHGTIYINYVQFVYAPVVHSSFTFFTIFGVSVFGGVLVPLLIVTIYFGKNSHLSWTWEAFWIQMETPSVKNCTQQKYL